MEDGTIATSAGTYSINVLNIDDAPPQSLNFASGGMVAAGTKAVLIGRLSVSDPDTTSGFTYTIREDNQWMFEVVNGDLRLHAGVSLALADGPFRPLVITVSDGMQSQAFTIMIGVTVAAIGDVDNGGVTWHAARLDRGRSRESVAMDLINWRMNTLNHDDARAQNGGFFVPRSWVMDQDLVSPLGMGLDTATFAHWWASQIISGRVDGFSIGEEFERIRGILPRLDGLANRSAIERFFTEMTGAPPESNWADSLSQVLEKTSQTATEYFQALLRETDLQEAYDNQVPQGTALGHRLPDGLVVSALFPGLADLRGVAEGLGAAAPRLRRGDTMTPRTPRTAEPHYSGSMCPKRSALVAR